MADTSDFRNGLVINHKNNLVKIYKKKVIIQIICYDYKLLQCQR